MSWAVQFSQGAWTSMAGAAVPGWSESPHCWVGKETPSLPRLELSYWKVQPVTKKWGRSQLRSGCHWLISAADTSPGIVHLVHHSAMRLFTVFLAHHLCQPQNPQASSFRKHGPIFNSNLNTVSGKTNKVKES